ncbi:MAG: hypothetical protein LBU11_06590 [Zoogloeaceae bacterium]|jgi:hypothetical protein|nr:hypothetical protein [Zoogloeaceae bacterium]
MKKLFLVFIAAAALFSTALAADGLVPVAEDIETRVLAAMEKYVEVGTCSTTVEGGVWGEDAFVEDVFVIEPYGADGDTGFYKGEYGVLWHEVVGCGAHLIMAARITFVGAEMKGGFRPGATLDLPIAAFEDAGTSSVASVKSDAIVINGVDYGENDANCCPAQKIAVTLKRKIDHDGHYGEWEVVKTENRK